jgi:hypothetical protein
MILLHPDSPADNPDHPQLPFQTRITDIQARLIGPPPPLNLLLLRYTPDPRFGRPLLHLCLPLCSTPQYFRASLEALSNSTG